MAHDGGDMPPPPPGVDDEFQDAEENVQNPQQGQQQQFGFNPTAPSFMWPPQFLMPPPWLQQQPHVQAPRPDRVKLGSFLQSRPSMWFNLAEALSARNFFTASRDVYYIVLSSLPDEVVKKLGAIANMPDGHVVNLAALASWWMRPLLTASWRTQVLFIV